MRDNKSEVKPLLQTVAVDLYVEPISGKRFKSPELAEKYGAKMRVEQAVAELRKQRLEGWAREVKDKASLSGLKSGLCRLKGERGCGS